MNKNIKEKNIPTQAKDFPLILTNIMRVRNITISRLAAISGVDPKTIKRYLSGETVPDYYMIARISDALDVLPTDLYHYSQDDIARFKRKDIDVQMVNRVYQEMDILELGEELMLALRRMVKKKQL